MHQTYMKDRWRREAPRRVPSCQQRLNKMRHLGLMICARVESNNCPTQKGGQVCRLFNKGKLAGQAKQCFYFLRAFWLQQPLFERCLTENGGRRASKGPGRGSKPGQLRQGGFGLRFFWLHVIFVKSVASFEKVRQHGVGEMVQSVAYIWIQTLV